MFISSAGGHLTELMQLKSLLKKYSYSIVTEKTESTLYLNEYYSNVFYLTHISRKPRLMFIYKFIVNIIKSIFIYIKAKPDVIVTTGANAVVPICYIGKLFGKKIVYIESFARVKSLSLTGRIMNNISDVFCVQHEEMLDIVKKSQYEGSLF